MLFGSGAWSCTGVAATSLLGRRLVLVFVEPSEDRARLGSALRRTRRDAAVAGAGHLPQRRRNADELQRGVIFLRLADRAAITPAAHHTQSRRGNVADQGQRRADPVELRVLTGKKDT